MEQDKEQPGSHPPQGPFWGQDLATTFFQVLEILELPPLPPRCKVLQAFGNHFPFKRTKPKQKTEQEQHFTGQVLVCFGNDLWRALAQCKYSLCILVVKQEHPPVHESPAQKENLFLF